MDELDIQMANSSRSVLHSYIPSLLAYASLECRKDGSWRESLVGSSQHSDNGSCEYRKIHLMQIHLLFEDLFVRRLFKVQFIPKSFIYSLIKKVFTKCCMTSTMLGSGNKSSPVVV